jgi:OOP family OmpA-OmpF porin
VLPSEENIVMRRFVAPFMSVVVMAGSSAFVGCGSEPKPEPKTAQVAPPPPPGPPAAPAPPPEPKKKKRAPKHTDFAMQGGALKLPGPVVFEVGSDKLKPESDVVLEVVEDYLTAKGDISLLRIEGHTDNDGAPAANQTLSEKRALAVARWLVTQGVDCHRLIPVGFGHTKPVAGTIDKQTKDDKEQNRRVAFVNAALKGKPIGGQPVDGGGKVAGDPCN